VYGTLTTTKGTNDDILETGAVVGEALYGWLSAIDGFEGMLLMCNEATGVTHLVSLWASQEIADKHEHSRRRFRDRITSTVDAEVQQTVGYEVAFAELTHRAGSGATSETGLAGYAALTTTKGTADNPLETARLVAEAMCGWLSEMEGWVGLLMLIDVSTETTQVISLWESREIAERQTHARLQFRDRMTATVNVEVQETVGYDVVFAEIDAHYGRTAPS
jgi:hypothetical protein